MVSLEDLCGEHNELATHYSRFQVTERILLTGHSHQAWPDVGFDGQQEAWCDAAQLVDDKWDAAFAKAERVKQFYCDLLQDKDSANFTLASNTHELLVRFLSAVDLPAKPRIVTTDGEFHSMRRQLDRLAEEGIEIVRVAAEPLETLAERILSEVTDGTAAVMLSAVLFRNSAIVPGVKMLADAVDGTPLLVDAYHALNVLPFTIEDNGLEAAFIVGGGYKYCQMGEGNCFMRVPPGCDLRPVVTGWYAEFGDLEGRPDTAGQTRYVTQYVKGADRFQGSTYDPTSHYRATRVADFFIEQELTPELLREVSQYQVRLLAEAFDDLDADPSVITRIDLPLEQTAGFLALRCADAARVQQVLRDRQVYADQRDGMLRLGPAPYLTSGQLRDAIGILGQIVKART